MTQPEMHIDGGVPISEVIRRQQEREIPRRERTERDILIDIADLLTRQLGETQHIRAALTALNEGTALFSGAATNEPRESRSSVEIKTSTRGVDVTTKAYDGSDVGALVGPAVDAYFAALEQVQARVNGSAA